MCELPKLVKCIKKQRHHYADKRPSSHSYSFPSDHVWTWELDHKEGWAPKNWCFWTVVLEKTLESPLDCNQSILKEISPEYSLEGLMLKLKLPTVWPPDAKIQLGGKDPDAGKDWRQEKWVTEDEMAGWHHQLNGHEFEQALGDSGEQRSLGCPSPQGCRELDMT